MLGEAPVSVRCLRLLGNLYAFNRRERRSPPVRLRTLVFPSPSTQVARCSDDTLPAASPFF